MNQAFSRRTASSILLHAPWLLLAAAAPFYLFPSARYWQGLLLVPLAGLAGWWLRRNPLPQTRFNPAVLALALAMLVSTWATYDLALSLPKLAGLVFGLALFLLASAYGASRSGWTILLAVLIALGAGAALVGLTGMQRVGEAYSKIPALFRLLLSIPVLLTNLPGAMDGINPNELGGVLLWVIYPAAAAWVSLWRSAVKSSQGQDGNRFWQKARLFVLILTCGSALLLILFAFVLTQSRAAYAGFALLLPVLLALSLPRRNRWPAIAILMLVGIFITAAAASRSELLPNSTGAASRETSLLSTTSLAQRVQIWGYGLSLLRDFPVTGIGMNVFRFAVYDLFPFPCGAAPCDLGHAHNEFLQAGLDLGILGAAGLLALYLVALRMLISLYRCADRQPNPDVQLRLLTLGMGGGLFSHLIYGMFDAVSLGAKPGFLFWLLLGLICGLYQQQSAGRGPDAGRQNE